MSKKLAEILTSLLVDYIDRVEGINTGSDVSERIEQMFINGNFVSIEYWVEARLRNK